MKIENVNGNTLISTEFINPLWERNCIRLSKEEYDTISTEGIKYIESLLKDVLISEIESNFLILVKNSFHTTHNCYGCSIQPTVQEITVDLYSKEKLKFKCSIIELYKGTWRENIEFPKEINNIALKIYNFLVENELVCTDTSLNSELEW